MARRGGCPFREKAQRAQTAGAVALVVIDGPRIEIEDTSTLTLSGSNSPFGGRLAARVGAFPAAAAGDPLAMLCISTKDKWCGAGRACVLNIHQQPW